MKEKLKQVLAGLEALKLKDIKVYDFRGFSPFFDYQVIASASSERQVHASIHHIRQALPGEVIQHLEGQAGNRWLLFDLGDILVHVLHRDEREYYQFEKLFIGREAEPLHLEP
ncbi:MAG: ribosome silencing factor [Candidatus Izemoplasmatales bacterium]|jgi:ribosome-associated protein